MGSLKDARSKKPGKQAANARSVLAGSRADKGESERLAALPPWARTRIAELEAELARLETAVVAIRVASRELDQMVVAADDGDIVELEDAE